MQKLDLSISLVTYKNDKQVLTDTVQSVLESQGVQLKLYIVDNSPSDEIGGWYKDERVEYIFNKKNLGFGAAHNIIMKDDAKLGKYHLVLNPDIKFEPHVLKGLMEYMDSHPDVGNIIPRVYYTTGKMGPMCKLLPTPYDFFVRMLVPFKSLRMKTDKRYLMSFCDYDKIINAPYLSGCFFFLRSSILKEIGVYDEGMFMYAEDVDLCRRIHVKYKTLYYPDLSIIHHGAEESHRSFKLMKIHIKSCIYYLNKWGWFFDKERNAINRRAIEEYSIK